MENISSERPLEPMQGAEPVAGRGLLHRRALLGRGMALAGAAGALSVGRAVATAAEPLTNDPWTLKPGEFVPPYQQPSHYESDVVRLLANPNNGPRTSHARAPLQLLNGTITPNGVHFSISRSGAPDIDPAKHRLLIHGLVKQPLIFTLEKLERYPLETRIAFVECGGNSAPLYSAEPLDANVQGIHGLISCAEWTGVRVSTLLEEAGIDPYAKWVIAEGADASNMHRSVPLDKCLDDAMIALYQNGERVNPSNGYPMRLLLPGYEGNMNVKWLRRLKLVEKPIMAVNESREYTLLLPNGKIWRFFFPMEVKSVITRPSPGLGLNEKGYYQISGLAWSGQGKIRKVEVSADGGKSWAEAALQEPVLSKALTRFQIPWRWDGGPAILQSRATDETGAVQPTRDAIIAERGAPRYSLSSINAFPMTHVNAISSWAVSEQGALKNVYA